MEPTEERLSWTRWESHRQEAYSRTASEAARKAVQSRWAKLEKLREEITVGTKKLLRAAKKREKLAKKKTSKAKNVRVAKS
jgi:hypothetical protein